MTNMLTMVRGFKYFGFQVVIVLSCLLMNGCGEKANAWMKKVNTDSACLVGKKAAKKDAKEKKYSIYISNLEDKLGPYAEEMFELYYHKKVEVKCKFTPCIVWQDENDKARDNCYENYMDSVVATFGPNVYEKVVQGAKDLYEKEPLRYYSPYDCWGGQPQFPGGDSALNNALRKNIHYPIGAKRDSVMGTVFVRIDLDSMGKVTNAVVVKGVRSDLDSAAIVGVMKLPNFLPLYSRGKKISGSTIKPVKFVLQ